MSRFTGAAVRGQESPCLSIRATRIRTHSRLAGRLPRKGTCRPRDV